MVVGATGWLANDLSEAQLRKLTRTLKVQRSKYRINLEKLIETVAPHLGIQVDLEDFCDPIWNRELNARVNAYLDDRYKSFERLVEDYQECKGEIAKNCDTSLDRGP